MKNVTAALAAAILAASVTLATPGYAADEPTTPQCDVIGDATCEPATCEDDVVVYKAKITHLERRQGTLERRIEHKNATIKRLRAALAAQR